MSNQASPIRTVAEPEGQPVAPAAQAPADDPPSHIGRYRVERLLGQGGFGRVYLARDEQLQRRVAVKMPHPYLVTRPEDAGAYLAEARTVAGLDHPHIVPVFDVGSPADERGGFGEDRRSVKIDYPFAVAVKLVAVAEFKLFRPDFPYAKQYSLGEDTPINAVSWYDAAAYCNWLSEQEKVPNDQWCYEPNAKGEYAEGMKVEVNYQELSGYRLPREAEWEHACRAGTVTAWSHGSDESLLSHYAWYSLNSSSTMHPVGALKPNGLGLFDVHGNAWQWCQDTYEMKIDKEYTDINNKTSRVIRGGSFIYDAWDARSSSRIRVEPAYPNRYVGFRVARTYH